MILVVCLYLRVRELEEKEKSGGGDSSGGSPRGGRSGDSGVDYDTRLDISDRSTNSSEEVRNPLDDDDHNMTGDVLTTIELNSLKQQYLDD